MASSAAMREVAAKIAVGALEEAWKAQDGRDNQAAAQAMRDFRTLSLEARRFGGPANDSIYRQTIAARRTYTQGNS